MALPVKKVPDPWCGSYCPHAVTVYDEYLYGAQVLYMVIDSTEQVVWDREDAVLIVH